MLRYDEYKQAIEDALAERLSNPPRPSELPDTEDKLAAIHFAAAVAVMMEAAGALPLVLNVTVADSTATLDKTWQEIFDAVSAGRSAVVVLPESEGHIAYPVMYVTDANSTYLVACSDMEFTAASATGYPSLTLG